MPEICGYLNLYDQCFPDGYTCNIWQGDPCKGGGNHGHEMRKSPAMSQIMYDSIEVLRTAEWESLTDLLKIKK